MADIAEAEDSGTGIALPAGACDAHEESTAAVPRMTSVEQTDMEGKRRERVDGFKGVSKGDRAREHLHPDHFRRELDSARLACAAKLYVAIWVGDSVRPQVEPERKEVINCLLTIVRHRSP
jgi:hypothetical protein